MYLDNADLVLGARLNYKMPSLLGYGEYLAVEKKKEGSKREGDAHFLEK